MTVDTTVKAQTRTELRPGWRVVRFDAMAENVNDRVDDPAEAGVEYYVGLEHLEPESLKIRRWGKPTDVEATKLRFKPGDIIFGRRRAYQRKLAVAEFEGICSAHAMVLRAREQVVLPEFLPFFMQSDIFFERAMSISVGSLSPTINWKALAAQEFALPPRDEQRRIAEILWAIDAVAETDLSIAEALGQAINAVLHEKFSQNSIVKLRLADVCESDGIQIGPFGSQLHASDYVTEGIPVVMPSDMSIDDIVVDSIAMVDSRIAARLSLHKVKSEDILLPRRGDLTKRAFVRKDQEGWLCGTGSIRVRVKKGLSSRAVFFALSTPETNAWLADNAVGTTMPNLNTKIVSNIPIGLPSENEAELIVQLIEDLRNALALNTSKSGQRHLLKKRLLEKLLGAL